MFIRPLFRSDLPRLDEIRAKSKFPFDKFDGPDLFAPHIVEALVVSDSKLDAPRLTIAAKQVVELYMVMDHTWETPALRLSALEHLHGEMKSRLLAKGYDEAYCFLEPSVPEGYTRRLRALGWSKFPWRCMRMAGEQ